MAHKMNLYLTSLGIISYLGDGIEETLHNAIHGKNGPIKAELPEIYDDFYNTRCNQLIHHCYFQIERDIDKIKKKYSQDRLGVVLGTSNSGIEEAQTAVFEQLNGRGLSEKFDSKMLEMGNPSYYLKKISGVSGVCYSISTACSSSTKALSSARRLIENDICDAVIVGGADSLCRFADAGFASLEAVSQGKTNPFSKNRDGINIGEGAALFILDKHPGRENIKLLGIGETSDAYHITSPDPEGTEAARAMKIALDDAGLQASDIDYLNLHGTGTIHNDEMEANAVSKVFPDIPCSSTKPLTGHCLGASGAIELGLCWISLLNNKLILHMYDGEYDDSIPKINLVSDDCNVSDIKNCASNSFAFGGSNACIVIGS